MSDKSVNIKRLPEASDIEDGNFLIIEGEEGTSILDFKNFVITENNTTFQPLLSSHSTNIDRNYSLILTLSSNQGSLSGQWVPAGASSIYTLSSASIGTTSVTEKLTVAGNISASGSLSATSNTSYSYIESRLGIGISVPSEKLHLKTTGSTMSYARIEAEAAEAGVIIKNNQSHWYMFLDDSSFSETSRNSTLNFWNVHANDTIVTMTSAYKVGIGTTNPETSLHLAGNAGITLDSRDNTDASPDNPASHVNGRIYVRSKQLVIQYNDGGTVRYRTLPLSGTGTTWSHTTDAP
tara:strand:+ start:9379 stop:10260 length:882 start_codon:yes stop_codon:yes gene_type:complete